VFTFFPSPFESLSGTFRERPFSPRVRYRFPPQGRPPSLLFLLFFVLGDNRLYGPSFCGSDQGGAFFFLFFRETFSFAGGSSTGDFFSRIWPFL